MRTCIRQRANCADDANPATEAELKAAILKAALALPQEDINKAVLQFKRRCELCVEVQGAKFEHKKKRPTDLTISAHVEDPENYDDYEEWAECGDDGSLAVAEHGDGDEDGDDQLCGAARIPHFQLE